MKEKLRKAGTCNAMSVNDLARILRTLDQQLRDAGGIVGPCGCEEDLG